MTLSPHTHIFLDVQRECPRVGVKDSTHTVRPHIHGPTYAVEFVIPRERGEILAWAHAFGDLNEELITVLQRLIEEEPQKGEGDDDGDTEGDARRGAPGQDAGDGAHSHDVGRVPSEPDPATREEAEGARDNPPLRPYQKARCQGCGAQVITGTPRKASCSFCGGNLTGAESTEVEEAPF